MKKEHSDFAEAVRFLESRVDYEKILSFSGDDLGRHLDDLQNLHERLGNPEKKYRSIHVAGTKGKGSTCAFLETILRSCGCRVGRFCSPHLYSLTERFLIDGVPCKETEFGKSLLSLRNRIAELAPELLDRLTYFELTTLLAFEYFAAKKVDWAIFEVGLGGRLDATNICTPCLTLISNISFDHVEQLGPTLGEIAGEKGGIIKHGIPLISTVRKPEPQNVLKKIAADCQAPAYFLEDDFEIVESSGQSSEKSFEFRTKPDFPVQAKWNRLKIISLPGTHQQQNAALALAAVLLLQKEQGLDLDEKSARQGLLRAFAPIRVESVQPLPNGPIFIVDGGHNRASIKALLNTIQQDHSGKRLTILFGASLGKDIEGVLEDLQLAADRIVLTQYSTNPRRFPPRGLLTVLRSQTDSPLDWSPELNDDKPGVLKNRNGKNIEYAVFEHAKEALDFCWKSAEPDEIVCVTGSMYLAAELRKFFLRDILKAADPTDISRPLREQMTR